MSKWLINVIVMIHCLSMAMPIGGTLAFAQPTVDDFLNCVEFDFAELEDPDTGYFRLAEPIPSEGHFPDINGNSGSEYEIRPSDGRGHNVYLDGQAVILDSMILDGFGGIAPVTQAVSADVEAFLSEWSNCAFSAYSYAILKFVDTWSYTWLCDENDKFHVQASPLALTCLGSGARTKGSLPLELYFVGTLLDGRIVAVIGEGTNHDACGYPLGFWQYASLWILEKGEHGLMVRAAFGDLTFDSDEFEVIGDFPRMDCLPLVS